jgi:hypothetical protein
MNAKLIVCCPEYLQSVLDFADATDQRKQFEQMLYDLIAYLPDNWTVQLYKDFAPFSFFWTETGPNGEGGLIGGLIYHGYHDGGGNGDSPTYSVNLMPINGWSIHT